MMMNGDQPGAGVANREKREEVGVGPQKKPGQSFKSEFFIIDVSVKSSRVLILSEVFSLGTCKSIVVQ